MKLIPWLHPKPKLIPPEEQPAPFGRFTRGVFKGWPCPDFRKAMNVSDAGRVPSNEPEPVKVCGIEVVPNPGMRILCGECDYHLKGGAMNYCPQCGAALFAEFRWTPAEGTTP